MQIIEYSSENLIFLIAYSLIINVCKITDQSGLYETFRYDKEGRLTSHTDRNGTVTETKYNIYSKPVLRTCTDKAGNRRIMGTWEYDNFGNLKKAVAGGFSYTYDLNGNCLTKESYHSDSVDEAESYQYNERNELTKRTVAGDTAFITHHYDNNGSIVSEESEENTITQIRRIK